ncbi:hypothetical protein HDF22_003730 [Mucilaginibacter lappiensis]|uniref:Uncharacterized protein n=1 Tax=Mucilaginibacter lappiensis TaxID=354630 RepID=A0A841JEL7_9SPHI|nr:hypothetical protein [Mucilaginibacter lappiensis]
MQSLNQYKNTGPVRFPPNGLLCGHIFLKNVISNEQAWARAWSEEKSSTLYVFGMQCSYQSQKISPRSSFEMTSLFVYFNYNEDFLIKKRCVHTVAQREVQGGVYS